MTLDWFISHIGGVVLRRLKGENWRIVEIKTETEAQYHYYLSQHNIEYGEHNS